MHRAFIALGANLEDPAAQVRAALADLTGSGDIALVAASSLYRTAPIGADGPDYINAVAAVDTPLPPTGLLSRLFAVEAHFGRTRSYRNAPRTLDLDLLLYDDQVLDGPELTLPHPRLHLRAFVLVPLAEIAPDLALPGRGSVAAWLPAVANQRIEKL
ncbi:MAG: 2-amino-4-hydroxy-6-hydroxymethyldihydropteridine diphosphokinase [Azospira sp.]|jgi:2-amino-4-hydroxy-6-hydroxymethyldihydropteridine diphosphokinase|uniref:2-amino-4-hydroxy-6-hydroxymethyldihydropteridine pyrophosphokinase n=1 Tax=Azospira oryzae (strain ATCC BAA-33 / DSM 13638 / PS) TaxID=640081 RepID=G8QP50_AZOOP|nr:2-amino-4-hydroxy-6-hydroxymethyldihydropteridine diphosphokinase [Azospira oryzae]AEV25903.1 2-amino-4-hydroxy-6-hydroxymethyldihydropteridine pyrophosphokinase [Azospira oryzae PS]MBP7488236.1 2-amino-4-hydroxy-6-hydroxymethyldihydropteridine diphosphokinase [Azospira sp.]